MSTIIGYPKTSSRVGMTDNISYAPLISHAYGGVFMLYESTGSTGGARRWDAWPLGQEQAVANLADCQAPLDGFTQPMACCWNRNAVAFCNFLGNGFTLLRQRDFSHLQQVPLNPGDAYTAAQQVVSISSNGDDVLISTTIVPTSSIQAISTSESSNHLICTMTEPTAKLGAYPDGDGDFFYALGTPSTNTLAYHLYKGNASSAGQLPHNIVATDIDPAWTVIDSAFGLIIDQTDNNPMAMFENLTDVGVQTYYLVKLDGTTGAPIWKAALPGAQNWDFWGMSRSLVKNQTLYYITTIQEIAIINTATGTFTTVPFSSGGLSVSASAQVSEDVSNSVYFKGSWSEISTHPNYAGTYMGTEGNHTVTNQVMRYFPLSAAPVVPTPAIMATSRQRSWTFTLDGHKFYVLDLGDHGTLLYDITTGSWSEFVTTNYNNWNFRNGTMWDQRIVGGDTDTQQIWEMAPSYMLDNGVTPIEHIVTGGLVKRNRVFSSCAALRLNVSVGQLDDSIGATVLLEFSDDQGKTWTQMDLLSLVEGDFDAELAWQGLGSFAAPGRVFRITDVGGFIRIDGCDVEMDDFDEDNNSAARDE